MNETFPDDPVYRVSHWDGDVMVIVLMHYIRVFTSLGLVTIPSGFRSDGLSIPRCAWGIIGPGTGRAFRAGLLHDFLYSKSSDHTFRTTRKQADDLFLEAMWRLDIPWAKRRAMYLAVRAFGWKHYKKK